MAGFIDVKTMSKIYEPPSTVCGFKNIKNLVSLEISGREQYFK